MFRIDTPGALPGGVWDEGNPFNATDGTIASADWYNAVQEELAGFVEALGFTLDKTDSTQLFQAFERFVGARMSFDAPAPGVVINQALLLGNSFGVVRTTAATGLPTSMYLLGEWRITKSTSDAMTVGDAVWWDDTAKELRNSSASGRYRVGAVMVDELAAAGDVKVRLDGVAVEAVP